MKNLLDAQLILGIFRQLLHFSGISRPIIRRCNCMYTTVGTYCSLLSWLDWNSNPTRTTQSNLNLTFTILKCLKYSIKGKDHNNQTQQCFYSILKIYYNTMGYMFRLLSSHLHCLGYILYIP